MDSLLPWIIGAAALLLILLLWGTFVLGRRAGVESVRHEFNRRFDEHSSASGVAESEAWPVTPPPNSQKVAVIINPSKNDAERALRLIRVGCAVRSWSAPFVLETTEDSPGREQTLSALRAGADLILCAGGDGTVREVARVLSDEESNPDQVPLGIVPLGTGNLLARNLGLDVLRLDPRSLENAVDTALEGKSRRIDTAKILIEDAQGQQTEDTFLVMGGVGLDAEVIAATNDELKKKVGWLAYTDAGIRLLPGKRKSVEVSLNGAPYVRTKVRSILFANLGKLPAGVDFIPDAEVDDGLLSIVIMSPRGPLGWAWIAAKTISRSKASIPVMHFEQAQRISVRSEEPLGTQLDGDLTGEAVSIEASILPLSLTVHVPEKSSTFLRWMNPGASGD